MQGYAIINNRNDVKIIKEKISEFLSMGAGIERSAHQTKNAIFNLNQIGKCFNSNASNIYKINKINYYETLGMLWFAKIILYAAYKRTETKGCHIRTDYPQKNSEMEKHFKFQF